MTDDQIKHMVGRFLAWRLPENFNPDAGISFKPDFNEHTPHPMKHEPTGTNLFDGGQAEAMIRYMAVGLPVAGDEKPDREMVNLLEHAAHEVQDLRTQRDRLAAQMDVVNIFRTALLGAPPSQGYGVDVASSLRKKIEEMRAQPVAHDTDG